MKILILTLTLMCLSCSLMAIEYIVCKKEHTNWNIKYIKDKPGKIIKIELDNATDGYAIISYQ